MQFLNVMAEVIRDPELSSYCGLCLDLPLKGKGAVGEKRKCAYTSEHPNEIPVLDFKQGFLDWTSGIWRMQIMSPEPAPHN